MTSTELLRGGAAQSHTESMELLSPFLRWAGGKRWLVPQVTELLRDTNFSDYHEPFLGGGSVFFALPLQGNSYLSDLNFELIEVYQQVRDNPILVTQQLQAYENTAECYYAARNAAPANAVERAARFIYLNHTSYNGIYRVNLRGKYNVPYGNRKWTRIPDETALTQASVRLNSAHLCAGDFEVAFDNVRKNDLVFLDPPYTVAHNNNGFIKYNQHLFSFQDQQRLAAAIKSISNIGAYFILTNAAHESIDSLFSPLGRRLTITRRNSIGGKKAVRGNAEEYLFTNIEAMCLSSI